MNTSLQGNINRKNARPPAFMLPILKLPLLLYRTGLGWLLGYRFMLLTHVGRRSGKVYQTVLAVLSFDPKTRELKAISAWSASDWYKNIQTLPALQVDTGFTRYVPVFHALYPPKRLPHSLKRTVANTRSSAGLFVGFPVGNGILPTRSGSNLQRPCMVLLFSQKRVKPPSSVCLTSDGLSFVREN